MQLSDKRMPAEAGIPEVRPCELISRNRDGFA
jgi:hypothetical protein